MERRECVKLERDFRFRLGFELKPQVGLSLGTL